MLHNKRKVTHCLQDLLLINKQTVKYAVLNYLITQSNIF